MENIAPGEAHGNDLVVYVYFDTVEAFFPRVWKQRHLAQLGQVFPCRSSNGFVWGYRVAVNQPSRQILLRLDQTAQQHGGKLCRFDVAVDLQPSSAEQAEGLRDFITRSAVLRWRRPGSMYEEDGTIYWIKIRKGEKRPTRNLVLYADKPNRITGELDCVHLELRFLKAAAIKRQGILRVRDLLEIDPNHLLQKHVKWTDAACKYVTKTVRANVKEDRKRYSGRTTSSFTDQYRAAWHKRVRTILRKLELDRAQVIRDTFPKRATKAIPCPFEIPTKVEWKEDCRKPHKQRSGFSEQRSQALKSKDNSKEAGGYAY